MLETGKIYKKDRWQIDAFKRFRPLIERFTAPSAVHNILDLGCGNGVVTQYLSSLFPNAQVLGIDADPKMIEYARKNNTSQNIVFELSDIRCLEQLFANAPSFDLVNANYVLHWLSAEEKNNLLEKLQNITSRQARLMIGTCQRFPNFLQFLDDNIRAYLKIPPQEQHYLHYLSEHGWIDL